jgi:hypothetical protein
MSRTWRTTPFWRTLTLPSFSTMNIRPSGAQAMPTGDSSPEATVCISKPGCSTAAFAGEAAVSRQTQAVTATANQIPIARVAPTADVQCPTARARADRVATARTFPPERLTSA